MRKILFLTTYVLMLLLLSSCNNKKNNDVSERPTDSVISENENEVSNLKNTIIEDAKYFSSQSVLEDINSQDVIGFCEEGAYVSEYKYANYVEFCNLETSKRLDINTQIRDIIDVSYSDNNVFIGGFTNDNVYHIDMLDKDFSYIKNIVTESFGYAISVYDSESIVACVSETDGHDYIKKYNLSGEVIETIDLTSKFGFSKMLISDMYVAQDGCIVIETSTDMAEATFCVLDKEYNVVCDAFDYYGIRLNDDVIHIWGKIIGKDENNNIIFSSVSQEGEIFLYRYDFKTDEAEEIDCLSGSYIYEGNDDYDIFYKNQEGVFGYRIEDKSSTLISENVIADTATLLVSDDRIYAAERIDNYSENVYLCNIVNGEKTEYFSVESNQIISMQKALSNGIIQLVEEYEDKCFVHIYDVKTGERNKVEIEYEEGYSVSDLLVVGNNNILADFYNENENSNVLKLFNGQGEKVSVISLSSNERIEDMVLSPDGRVFVHLQTDDDEYFKEIIDMSELSEQNMIPNSYIMWMCNGKDQYDFFYVTEKGVYGVEFDKNICTLLFSKQESDVPYDISIHDFYFLDDKAFYIATFESVYKLFCNEDVINNKTEINIADLVCIPNEVIADFERKYPQYDVNVIDYTDMTADDFSKRLDLDIISGDDIDIIYFNHEGMYDATNHNDKNAYVDYYELIENDNDFSKSEYIWSVFETMEDDGALYQLTPEFMVKTIVCNSDFADKNLGWNVEEFGKYIKSDAASVYIPNQDSMIASVCRTGNFVDYEKAKANFNSDVFADILNGIIEKSENSESDWGDNSIRFVDIYGLETLYIMQQNDMRGNKLANIVFPDVDGNGAFIVPFSECSILRSSENIDASWCFVKYLLSKEYYDDFGITSFSVRHDVSEEEMVSLKKGESINTEMMDEKGNIVKLGLPDDEILNKTLDIIKGAKVLYKNDFALDDIIGSECYAYNSDVQDIKTTVKNIQSRVQIYLSEQH